jgi:hypothetical protein
MPKLSNMDILKNRMVDALEKSLGVVTSACKSVGIARQTFYDWYKNDEQFQKEVDSIQDIALDFAESKLHKQIDKGDTTATIFYLKTKGKKRGYIERTETEHSGELKTTVINLGSGKSENETT